MKQTFIAISTELNTKLNVTAITDIFGKLEFIDLWNNQFERIDQENPIPFPAIFIEFGEIIWLTEGKQVQKGEVPIIIHVGQKKLSNSFVGSNDQVDALKTLDYLCEVHKVLQNFKGTNFTPLDRTGTSPDVDHGNVIAHNMEYLTTISDASAHEDRDLIEKTAVLKVEVTNLPDDPPPPAPETNQFIVKC